MKPDKNRDTDSVLNIIMQDRKCTDEYMQRMLYGYYQKISNHGHVQAHKKVFGPQTYCWNGEFRYWIWDFGTWRVYVSNQKGVAVEVNLGTSLEDTMTILRTYWDKVGA